ncbi:MAG: glycosyltransferase family 8 protein [Cyanobacteria bacterium SIG27]|nr:glycosyltransferase family 8 protein [Cyanobacteria bacterium SIG27]
MDNKSNKTMSEKKIQNTIKPIFSKNYSAIAMSSSEEYLPYLCVCLQSLIDNADKKHNYDIIIFSSCENEEKKNIVTSKYSKKNISVRFYNPKRHFENIKLYISAYYFNEACYYRIITPEAMPDYKKVVFTDIDLIFNSDIQELYNLDIAQYAFASCIEEIWEKYIDESISVQNVDIAEYSKTTLKLTDLKKYFNTGVAIINIEEFNKQNYCPKLKEIITKNNFLFQEQCALNVLLNSKTKVLPSEWNIEISKNYPEIYNKYNLKDMKIIHWLGPEKPWKYPDRPYAKLWWKYAKKTPYFNHLKKYKKTFFKRLMLILNT